MSRISRNISIILRSERLMARRRIAVLTTRAGLMVLAVAIVALAMVMLNVAGFFALRDTLGAARAALVVAGVDVFVALIIVLIATRLSAEKDLEPVAELRDIAIADLEAEAEEAIEEVRSLSRDVRAMARDPWGALLPGMAAPILSAILKSVSGSDDKPDNPEKKEDGGAGSIDA